jgi:hypothetical protein
MAFTVPRDWVGGELVTEAIMDTHVRDNFLAMGPHLIVRKTADESLTSNTTLQNDDVLLLPLLANEIWQFVFGLSMSAGSGTGDIKVAFTFPAGGEISASAPGPNENNVFQAGRFEGTTTPTASVNFGFSASATSRSYQEIRGVFINAGTAGNLQLQWAQRASSATATIMRANSTLWAVKLN